ncbi:MAG: hypothetical protein EA358_02550 [Flavobacteriales bacterium]|nr:MAG: hypothetical protein EA358_02550 [Flavobacteriales bacterium]
MEQYMKRDSNIDQYFQKRLSDFEVAPPPGEFDKIVAQLPEEKKKPTFFWWGITAAVLTVLLSLPFVFQTNEELGEPVISNIQEESRTLENLVEMHENETLEEVEGPSLTQSDIVVAVQETKESTNERSEFLRRRMQEDIDELERMERSMALQAHKLNTLNELDEFSVALAEDLSNRLELQAMIEQSFDNSGIFVQEYRKDNRVPDVLKIFPLEQIRLIELSEMQIVNRFFSRDNNKSSPEE